jgi:hypothetical protein
LFGFSKVLVSCAWLDEVDEARWVSFFAVGDAADEGDKDGHDVRFNCPWEDWGGRRLLLCELNLREKEEGELRGPGELTTVCNRNVEH